MSLERLAGHSRHFHWPSLFAVDLSACEKPSVFYVFCSIVSSFNILEHILHQYQILPLSE